MSNQQTFAPDDPERHKSKRKKIAKPFIVEWRCTSERMRQWYFDWHKFGAYQTLELAEKVVALKNGQHHLFEYRVKPTSNS